MARYQGALELHRAIRLDAHDRFDLAETAEEKARIERFQYMTPEKIAPLTVYLASAAAEGIVSRFLVSATTRSTCSTSRGRCVPSFAPRAGPVPGSASC